MGGVRSGGVALTLVLFSGRPAVAADDTVSPEGILGAVAKCLHSPVYCNDSIGNTSPIVYNSMLLSILRQDPAENARAVSARLLEEGIRSPQRRTRNTNISLSRNKETNIRS